MSIQCYNKGCGQKYEQTDNDEDTCQHHPGDPVFHDATKKWSCCGKWSTDFTEFLSIKGCTKGAHSNIKPITPEKETKNESSDVSIREIIPEPIPKVIRSRPDGNETKVSLKVTVASSAKTAYEQKLAALKLSEDAGENVGEAETLVRVGAACKHNGCTATYSPNHDGGVCSYHPGYPVFHEGCKFWSCCNIKRTDFSDFLAQSGCATGDHAWTTKEDEKRKRVDCRLDHFQTGNNVTINIYAKASVPGQCIVMVNRVAMDIDITFEAGDCNFVKKMDLAGTIDPARSSVKLTGTKVEITLRKEDLDVWKSLEL